VTVHQEVLCAAVRICRQRGGWRFRPIEIVRALPHLNSATVRTHIVSRCCVNAPKNHPHKWDYFKRIGRGDYEIRRRYRESPRTVQEARKIVTVVESGASYATTPAALRDTVHAVVSKGGGWYTAECLEVAIVTQGRTLDELVVKLQEALGLHLQGEDTARLGLVAAPRLAVIYELRAHSD
jgi:predicted RNase H-like HicB family nuclease